MGRGEAYSAIQVVLAVSRLQCLTSLSQFLQSFFDLGYVMFFSKMHFDQIVFERIRAGPSACFDYQACCGEMILNRSWTSWAVGVFGLSRSAAPCP